MASIAELVRLFNDGELGKLIAREFRGERGHVNPNEDSDFLVVFKSDSETPAREAVAEVVTKHYTGLGYAVRPVRDSDKECFQAEIYKESDSRGFVHIVITTRYPFNKTHSNLRVNSNIIA
ncbi:MAG: hypothetical protein Q7S86_04280 [bacterium]|nr:hypothetical protein [bacterium]